LSASDVINLGGCAVRPLTGNERALLKSCRRLDGRQNSMGMTWSLARRWNLFVLFVRNSPSAAITTKGRHALTFYRVIVETRFTEEAGSQLRLA
jgi:hypothetical protein